MIEVTLETIQVSLISSHRIVVLKDAETDRYLPIWIGPCEAEAITVGVKGIEVRRPLTHDVIVAVIDALRAELLHIFISTLADNTYYATLVLSTQEGEVRVDARPSDAVATAVRLGVPIYVAESVMDEAGVMPEQNILDQTSADSENLGVFRDFLSSLDMADTQDN
ncbi:MAG: bifunctional nuclease family protein [Anaerolineae bacterium]|nr:bifunctional nuclease family protein [Anaerolineae bacterium]